MKKSCPKTLDRPILLFGLEAEEVACIALMVGIASLMVGPTIPGLIGICSWFGLIHFKKDKPEGYLLHLFYTCGLPLPGCIPSSQFKQRCSIQ